MSENLNDLGLTAAQQKVFEEELKATQSPSDVQQHMQKFQKLAEENEVLSRASEIKAGRTPEPGPDDE